MHPDVQKLIDLAKSYGSITSRQREIIINKAHEMNDDMVEVEFVLDDIPLSDFPGERTPTNSMPKQTIVDTTVDGENIKCPYCGGVILAVAKKCKHCHAYLLQTGDGVVIDECEFITHLPTIQVQNSSKYIFTSKSELLKVFRIKDGAIHIETMDGSTFDSTMENCLFSYEKDEDSFTIHVKSVADGSEISFEQMETMLMDEEWLEIQKLAKSRGKKSTWGKIQTVLDVASKVDEAYETIKD